MEKVFTLNKSLEEKIQDYRKNLLDISLRNKLIKFSHGNRSKRFIRFVDEVPSQIFDYIVNKEKIMRIKDLPGLDAPEDENTVKFKNALDAELNEKGVTGDEDFESEVDAQRKDREIRNIVREKLGMPKLPEQTDIKAFAEFQNINPDYDLPTKPEGKKHEDSALQTLYSAAELNRRLSNLYNDSKTNEKDKGISTLYLVFGFLEWRESPTSATNLLSPLVLVPMSMECKVSLRRGEAYKISSVGRPVLNKCLDLKLNESYRMALPELDFNDDGDLSGSIEDYFKKVEDCIKKNPKWRVRRFVTLTNLDFNKVVMYEDLDPAKWENNPLSSSGTIREVFWGDSGVNEDESGVCEVPAEKEYDIDKEAAENSLNDLLIKEADSSQHSAILEAMSGNNMVVVGPPGTGKSQTITNLIAQALVRGKKVLFVCEKLAALSVVNHCPIKADNVYDASLGDFCFELHSNTSKKSIHSAMAHRLEINNIQSNDYDGAVKDLKIKRRELRAFSDRLQKKIGNSNYTYVEAVWALEKIRQNLDNPEILEMLYLSKDVSAYSKSEIDSIAGEVRVFSRQCLQIRKVWPDILTHPWRWVRSAALNQSGRKELIEKISGIICIINKICGYLEELKKLIKSAGGVSAKTIEDVEVFISQSIPDIDEKIIKRFEDPEYLAKILAEKESYGKYAKVLSALDAYTDRGNDLKAIIENRRIENILDKINSFEGALPDRTLTDIKKEHRRAELNRNYIERILSLSGNFPQVFNSQNGEFSIIGIQAVKSALDELRSINEDYFAFILSGIHDEAASKDDWNEAYGKSLELERKFKKYPYSLDVKKLSLQDDISRQAVILEENSSVLKWIFGKESKLAKKVLYKICADARKLSKDEKINCLKKLAELKGAMDDLRGKDILSRSSIDFVLDENRDTTLRDYDRILRKIWGILLSNSNHRELLSRIFQLKESDLYRLLEAFEDNNLACAIDELCSDENINNDKDINLLYREILEEEKSLESIISIAGSLYLKDTVPVSDIKHLASVCGEADKEYSKLGDFLAFIKIYLNRTNEVVDGLINYIGALNNLTNDAELRSKLLGKNFSGEFKNALSAKLREYKESIGGFKESLKSISDSANGVPPVFENNEISPELFNEATLLELNTMLEKSEMLSEYCELNKIADSMKEYGILDVLYKALSNGVLPEKLCDVFFAVYLFALLDNSKIPGIRSIAEIEHLQNGFKEIDAKLYGENAQYIAGKLVKSKLDRGVYIGSTKNFTEFELVRHEAGKKQSHIPIRSYLSKALNTVLALKPCFMMSPQTVSQYLPRRRDIFDLLIIDEASQMVPADAIAAMARSRQVVIVGDSKQLPPTNFFSANIANQDDDVVDDESILDVAEGKLTHKRMLKWHYRARHESLINFSNKQFYDSKLIVFPSKDGRNSDYGIKYHFVGDGCYIDGVNEREADALTAVLPEIMKANPDKSIGIVAMNQKQAETIREKIDFLKEFNSDVVDYISKWADKLEDFFVKNLENVQGDERDIIIISFVYGPDENKNVSGRFGPINQQNGYRRLNVLFSRAKEQIHVFTSMKASEIKTSDVNVALNSGPLALKNYLAYAANGGIDADDNARSEPDNDFEESVGNFLLKLGYKVRYQVGSIGYFIDIVIDDDNGRHLLGIECDGAQYHSSKSARDRDKLRQAQLENLGWKIYRVWSTDWFHNRKLAEERLLNEVKSVVGF